MADELCVGELRQIARRARERLLSSAQDITSVRVAVDLQADAPLHFLLATYYSLLTSYSLLTTPLISRPTRLSTPYSLFTDD